ncbi:MAG: hypothetical protein NTX88_07060 [Candidatus Atribacteria bacterium]|nr:hypothetical protein [Candidatus Atribacteria bacterium]
MISPEESRLLLQHIIQSSTSQEYWGIWRVNDYQEDKNTLYEVIYDPQYGFGWRSLDDVNHFIVGDGTYRFIFDSKMKVISAVYPGFDLPFLPMGKENIDLFISNYVIDLQGNVVVVVSRENGSTVKSFEFDQDESLLRQTFYSPDGKIIKEGEFVYRDKDPDEQQIGDMLEMMRKVYEEKGSLTDTSIDNRTVMIPQLLPPGYVLRRSYLVQGEQGEMSQLIYSDGVSFFSVFQNIYPLSSETQGLSKRMEIRKEGELTTLAGERRGYRVVVVGSLEPDVLNEIFNSISPDGGR